jgi:cytochrome P460
MMDLCRIAVDPQCAQRWQGRLPEYHNVYMEPGSYEIYKNTKVFPEGTIMFKELQLTLPGENPDGSRKEPSGQSYFPGAFNGADVTVKDSKRYADTGGWGFFNFNHSEPKAPTAKGSQGRNALFAISPARRRMRSGPSSTGCWTKRTTIHDLTQTNSRTLFAQPTRVQADRQ